MIHVFGIKIDFLKYLNPILTVLFILLLYFLAKRVLNALFRKFRPKNMPDHQVQRAQTIHDIVNSCLKYIALILVILAILAGVGVNVTSIVAGLGIFAAILGLAFQDIMKDIISGVTIITEGQFSVGDTVEMNGFKGIVLSVGLKTTQIKKFDGEVKIISNRNITELINYSKFNILASVSVKTPYEVDFEKVTKTLGEVKKRLDGEVSGGLGEVTFAPVCGFDDDGVSYTVSCPCAVGNVDSVQSQIREAILEEFKKNKIELSYPHVIIKAKR